MTQAPRDIQTQLRSLTIATEQRPASTANRRGGRGRWVLVIVLMSAAVVGVGGYVNRQRVLPTVGTLALSATADQPVRMLTVALAPDPGPTPVLTATGKIVSDHTVSVVTKVSGQIVALRFEQGDHVEQGQRLATLEDVLYRARRDEAAARLERSKAQLEFQSINFARVKALIEVESAPSIEFADARRAVNEAEAQVAADHATLDAATKNLNDCQVGAPIAGVILQRNVEVGDFVAAEGGLGANANARFAVIADMNQLRVEVDVSELDIARLQKDMPCTIVPDAYKDRRYQGHVMWLDPGANYAKATVQVKVSIDNPDDFLRVEGSAQVAFLSQAPAAVGEGGAPSDPSIWIPATAIVVEKSTGQTTVFAIVDGRLRKTSVTLGRRSGDRVQVTAGLNPGQSIVVEGIDRIHDGQRVGSKP